MHFDVQTFFSKKTSVSANVIYVCSFVEGDVGCFFRDIFNFVIILAWNQDGKCYQGVNLAFC